MIDFSVWLKRARAAQGMTVRELAEASGLSKQAIHSWEQSSGGAARRNPSEAALPALEAGLGLSRADYPFDGAALAAKLAADRRGRAGARVRLYCRETATRPCFVGYMVEDGPCYGDTSGAGVREIVTDGAFAVRLLHGSDA